MLPFFFGDFFCLSFVISQVKLRRHFSNNIIFLQVGDIEGEAPPVKRLRRSSSDALQDMVGGDEISLYGSAPNNVDSTQVVYHYVNMRLFCSCFLPICLH